MSHFLEKQPFSAIRLDAMGYGAMAAVLVEVRKGPKGQKDPDLSVQPGIVVAKPDALVTPLPVHIKVLGEDESGDLELVEPSPNAFHGCFFVSVETFDPFHLLFELPKRATKDT